MNIAIIASTGKLGQIILKKLKGKASITSIVRSAAHLPKDSGEVIEKDFFALTADDVNKFDTVISAYGPKPGQEDSLVAFMEHAISLFKGNKKTRLLICGGVGPMYFDPEKTARVSDSPELPPVFVPLAKAESVAYDLLKDRKDFDWIYFTPPLSLNYNGEEKKAYQTGEDVLQFSAGGESTLSYEDYASAIVEEALSQTPKHNQIVSVADK